MLARTCRSGSSTISWSSTRRRFDPGHDPLHGQPSHLRRAAGRRSSDPTGDSAATSLSSQPTTDSSAGHVRRPAARAGPSPPPRCRRCRRSARSADRPLRQQRSSRPLAVELGLTAGHHADLRTQPVRLHRLRVRLPAGRADQASRRRRCGRSAMPQPDQVIHGAGHSVLVGGAHDVDGGSSTCQPTTTSGTRPASSGRAVGGPSMISASKRKSCSDSAACASSRPRVSGAQDQAVAVLLGRRVQALEQVEVEDADPDAEHDADQPGLLAGQRPGADIGAVAQLPRRRQHPLAGGRRWRRAPPASRSTPGPGDVGMPGDVVQGDALGRAPPLVVDLGHTVSLGRDSLNGRRQLQPSA